MRLFSVKRLRELQELDWEISAHEKSLAEVRAKLEDDSAVVSARTRLEELESRLAQPVNARRRAESSVQDGATKLETVEKRLYAGTVTNPRELSAYEEERINLQRRQDSEEETLLTLMVEIEDLQSARDEADRQLERLESERAAEVAELLEAERRLVGELSGVREVRNEVSSEIPDSALSVYELLRQSRDGYAVAKVERAMCQGCRLALPTMEAAAREDLPRDRPVQQLSPDPLHRVNMLCGL